MINTLFQSIAPIVLQNIQCSHFKSRIMFISIATLGTKLCLIGKFYMHTFILEFMDVHNITAVAFDGVVVVLEQ